MILLSRKVIISAGLTKNNFPNIWEQAPGGTGTLRIGDIGRAIFSNLFVTKKLENIFSQKYTNLM